MSVRHTPTSSRVPAKPIGAAIVGADRQGVQIHWATAFTNFGTMRSIHTALIQVILLTTAGAQVDAPFTGPCDCWKEPDSTYVLAMPPNDDGSSAAIPLPFAFNLYGDTYSTVYINNNGNLSFAQSFSTYTSTGFPNSTNRMVAPFWADVDTRNNGGEVRYKLSPTALVVNWVAVAAYNQQTQRRNWFQVTITNGLDSTIGPGNTVEFCYLDLQWTTGTASGAVNGFGGTPASVGANRGLNTGQFLQIGRFDQAGDAYDGPFGLSDGVDWLAHRRIAFDLSGTGAERSPIHAERHLCDTLLVCTGDTVLLEFDILGTGPDQTLATTITAPTLPLWTTVVDTSETHAQISIPIVASDADVGHHSMQITSSIVGNPSSSSQRTTILHVVGTPGAVGPIEGPGSVSLEQDVPFSVPPVPNAAGYTWSLPEYWEVIAGQNTASIVVRTAWLPGPWTICVEAYSDACIGPSACLDLDMATHVQRSMSTVPTLYPNPASERVWITLPDARGITAHCTLFDPSGRTIPHTMLNAYEERIAIDVSGLAGGVYVLHVDIRQERHVFKVHVQRP